MWTETADSYTTSDAGEIADFLNRMGNGQNNSNTDNVNAGETNTTTIQTNFTDWNKGTVKGQLVELKGLTTRRTQEANIYNNNTYDSTH